MYFSFNGEFDRLLQEKEGKTAKELALARDSYELAELLHEGQEEGNLAEAAASPMMPPVGEGEEESKEMSVEEEKDALKRRLAELEEGERQGLESR